MRRRPPLPLPTWSAGAIVAAIVLAGCGAPGPPVVSAGPSAPSAPISPISPMPDPEPAVDGLLIAASGPIQVTGETGGLVAFPRSPDEVAAVATGGGRIIAIDPPGTAFTADALASPVQWQPLDLSGVDDFSTLVAVSPDGRRMAMVAGGLQGPAFDLVIVDLRGGTARRLRIQRGANGPPAWLDETTVVTDVITPDGASGIAAIDVDGGAVTDRVGPGIEVAFSADGSRVVLIADGGVVLIEDAAAWRSGAADGAVRLPGRPDQTTERVAISPTGSRAAVVRSSTAGPTTIEIWLLGDGRWANAASIPVGGDGPATIAWLR